MHNETNERVQRIRSRVLAEKAALAELKAQLADNTDKYVKQLLQQASNGFDDVEVLFLGILQDERIPPRTPAEESRVLDHAEFFLERVAVPLLKAIQDMVAKFGPNVQSIG
jgi:hypothetical protein